MGGSIPSLLLATIPVSGEFVVCLEVVGFGMFGVEHFEGALWLVHF